MNLRIILTNINIFYLIYQLKIFSADKKGDEDINLELKLFGFFVYISIF